MVTRISADVTNIGLDISHLESNYDGEKSDDEPKPRFSDTLLFGMNFYRHVQSLVMTIFHHKV